MQSRALKNQDASKIGEEDVMKRDDDVICYRVYLCDYDAIFFLSRSSFRIHESLDVNELF